MSQTATRPNGTGQAPVGHKPPPPSIPFAIAARRKYTIGWQGPTVTMSAAGANVNLGPVEIPPTGFLRYLDIIVTATTAANAATVAFAADAPWNAISYVTLTNATGDAILIPVDGYALMLFNKYAALSVDPPFCDPRQSPIFSQTVGAVAAGGSFTIPLRVPLEIDPESGFGSVASMAANKSLQLGLQIAPTSAVYTTAPTTAPQVSATIYQAFWAQPKSDNGKGQPQQVTPIGNNSIMQWRLDTPAVSAGDKIVKFANTGNVMRLALLVYRNASQARSESIVPATHVFRLNNDELMYLPDAQWKADIAAAYGYTSATFDVANGLDSGVRPFHYFLSSSGKVRSSDVRYQFLPTLDTTLLQYRGTSFGAGMTTLYIYTNEVKATDPSALYALT